MKKLIITSLILLCSSALYAYSVTGKVIDSESKSAISGVSVAIEGLKAVTTTAADGSFSFKNIPAGYYRILTAHHLYGNNTVDIRVKRQFSIEIELSKTAYSILLVNSYNKNNSRPGSQSISSDDIKYMPMSGAGDSLHLLQSLPGVSSTFSMGSVPVIRGLNPVYDRTYIDDIPVDNPYHYITPLVPLLSSINEAIIDTATIYKGPYPMTFDDSTGSIIQIKTKEVEQTGVHGRIIFNPLLPLFPTIYCEAAPMEDFSIIFAGRRTYTDWAADVMQIESPYDFYFQDYYLKLRYNLFSKHRIYFTTIGSDDYISIKRFDTRTEYHAESLKWQYLINKNYFLETSFLRSSTNHYLTYNYVNGGDNPIDVSYQPVMYRFMQTLSADISIFDIKTGYEYIKHEDGVSGNIDISNLVDSIISKKSASSVTLTFPIEGNTIAIFNETAVDLYPVILNLGARYKYYGPLSSNSLSYRGMASYIIKDQNLKIYTGGGAYHAQPDMYYYLGNSLANLKESRSYNGVLGLEKKINAQITGQIEAYYAQYEDLFSGNLDIISDSKLKKFFQINPYSEDERGNSYGFEFFLKGKWGPVYGWTSYSIAQSRMSDGESEYYSDYDRTHIFKIALLMHKGKWTPSAVWHFSTSMPYTPVTGSTSDGGEYEPDYGKYNSARYGAQHKLDLKLSYTDGNIRIYGEVWNVYYFKGYNLNDDEVETNDTYLFPVYDKDNPYSSSNPRNQEDIPVFFWAGVEICF